MEEEARQILTRAVSPPERLGDLFLKDLRFKEGCGLGNFTARVTRAYRSRIKPSAMIIVDTNALTVAMKKTMAMVSRLLDERSESFCKVKLDVPPPSSVRIPERTKPRPDVAVVEI